MVASCTENVSAVLTSVSLSNNSMNRKSNIQLYWLNENHYDICHICTPGFSNTYCLGTPTSTSPREETLETLLPLVSGRIEFGGHMALCTCLHYSELEPILGQVHSLLSDFSIKAVYNIPMFLKYA